MTIQLSDYSYQKMCSQIHKIDSDMKSSLKDECKLVEKTIEYSYYLKDVSEEVFKNKSQSTHQRLSDEDSLIPILYARNIDYLFSSYELALKGFSLQSNSIMRSVLEVVCQIYLLHLTTKEKDLFLKNELGKLNPTEKAEFQKIYKFLSPAKVRETLYSETKRRGVRDLYSELSKKSHPSIIGAFGSLTKNTVSIEDTLVGILTIGMSNIIAYWEVYDESLSSLNTTEYSSLLSKYEYMIDLVPDKSLLSSEIKHNIPSSFKSQSGSI